MDSIHKIHFIGIGGIGMSGLARLFKHEGKEVSGSDIVETENTKKLIVEGIDVAYEQVAENIQGTSDVLCIDLVVYTEALRHDNPELVSARKSGIRTINYFEALSEVANEYYLIAVSGTHGKTTTTAMLIDILEEANFDPTAIVGSLRTKTGSNFRAGKSKYFIVEACEYKRHFLNFNPDMLIITNIEHEHVDYYKDLGDVQNAFHELAMKVPEDGAVIAVKSDLKVAPVLKGLNARVYDYKTEVFKTFTLQQPGLYNKMNAGAAKVTSLVLGIKKEIIQTSLENFTGTQRRFEYKGEYNGAHVYDDYAHHPTEINAVISGTKEKYPNKKIILVFQSHTYSRTHELFHEFVDALTMADMIILLPIYSAREENKSGVSAEKLCKSIQKKGTLSEYASTFGDAVDIIKTSDTKDSIILALGAGDVTEVTKSLIK